MTDTVLLEWDGDVAGIRLNRPEVLNALNGEMAEGLHAICRQLGEAPRLRAVLLTGEGRAFMAGGDIGLFAGEGGPARIDKLIGVAHAALTMLTELPVPVIAAVQGAVAGGGLSIACAADLIIAAEDAKFLMAYSRLGTSPDCGATWNLPRAMGLRQALGFVLLEETLDAPAALQAGLVNRVVPTGELRAQAAKIAQRVASGPTVAFGRTKKLLRQSLGRDLPEQLEAERENFVACSQTQDFAAGVQAFQSRQKPMFSGK